MTTNPQDDAERIRLKRLAKLQGAASPSPSSGSSSTPPSASSSATPVSRTPTPQQRVQSTAPKRLAEPSVVPNPVPLKKKAPVVAQKFDLAAWENETIGTIFNVTLSKDVADKSGYDIVWLKHLAQELEDENPDGPKPVPITSEIIDRLLIARLDIDPQGMSDDLEYLPVISSLPPQQTVFEYLAGCWKRAYTARTALSKKNYPPMDTAAAFEALKKTIELTISYAGLILQEPEMFPQPAGKPLGPEELVGPLISVSSLTTPLLSNSSSYSALAPSDVEQFLRDLAQRFEPDDEIDGILGPVVLALCTHDSLFRPEGLAGSDTSWRGIISALELLVSIKPIAGMITRLEDWNPEDVTAPGFEVRSLFGPLLRLGVFEREWPSIANSYFRTVDRPAVDVQSATASLRGTLKSLQSSLFQIFNSLVRHSPESRERVLQYFARIVNLNTKRAGMHVDPLTVSSDGFMINVQTILFRFCEPFMDANYTKIDRIDPLYFAHSDRINIKEETRVNATLDEAEEWRKTNETPNGPPPNFISDIFFLTLTMAHYGYLKTVSDLEDLARQYDDISRHLEMLEGDGSWRGTPFQARTEAAIKNVKNEQDLVRARQLAFTVQLSDPELVFRSISFTNFVSIWLIRYVDPRRKHPNPIVELPLPKEVPTAFRVLPEFALEDVIEYHLFVMRSSPDSLELSGKNEILLWALTFLTSTWYIKNPFLKAKIIEVLCYSCYQYDGRRSVLGAVLNTHQMSLKHLMPALMNFYVEVEQTGASSQFYDKFNSRRYIAVIFRTIWNNQAHRDALKNEASDNIDMFIRFVNLMINDVTYLMDESLSDLAKIHEIQNEMADTQTFSAQSAQYRREREGNLRSLERQASGYTQLGNSTVALLKAFTSETKGPFMVPEIVNKLAAMLDYNLEALAGPRCQELKVKEPEKYKFNPKQLLSDIIEVFLNLSDQGEFVQAVASDGRSYRKELFERAAGIARKRGLKSEDEIEKLRLFVLKVEEAKATMEAEEDLGDVPEEFLDPLMYTLMRDPVILPQSRKVVDLSTIKSQLLSDPKDPFNRLPLSIEDVIPDHALRARIDAWLAGRRNKNTAFDIPPEEVVKMDDSME